MVNFESLDKVIENTKLICKCTHVDLRCQVSCVAVTAAIAIMLQGQKPPSISEIIEISLKSMPADMKPDHKVGSTLYVTYVFTD